MRRLAFPVAALCGLALAVVPALAENKEITTGDDPNDRRFSPDVVAVKPGEKVTIRNTGAGFHNVVWEDGQDPGSGSPSVAPWVEERTFTASGEYRFYCMPHRGQGMTGTVHVNDAGTIPTGGGGTGTTTGGTGTTGTQTEPPPTTGTTSTTPSTNPLPPPPPDDQGAPRVSNARAIARRRVVVVRFTISEAARINARLFRGLRRIARRTVEVERSGPVRLRLRVRRPLKPGRYRVRLVLVDDAGNRATRTLSARAR